MGGPSWQFKRFADASSKQWVTKDWKGKVAAGLTNSASMTGDKESTLYYLVTLAGQHKMLRCGCGLNPANLKASTRDDVNYLGAFVGLVVVSPSDTSVDDMIPGYLKTAEAFGANFAEVTKRVSRDGANLESFSSRCDQHRQHGAVVRYGDGHAAPYSA